MKVNINNNEVELRYSLRAMLIYEAITNKAITPEDLAKYTNFVTFFYSIVKASFDYNKIPFSMGYDEFIDWLDDNGGEVLMVEFGQWYLHESTKNLELLKNTKTGEEDSKNKPKKSEK